MRWRSLVIWVILSMLPWQAAMAVRMDLVGPSHFHACIEPTPAPLLLPRDFVSSSATGPEHHHSTVDRHRHAVSAGDEISDPDGWDQFLGASAGGFGSMFVAMLPPVVSEVPAVVGTTLLGERPCLFDSFYAQPLERPPRLPAG